MTFHILGAAEMQERIAEGDARARGGDLTKEDFTAAIIAWTKAKKEERRIADVLSREEIGRLRGFDRIDVLKKSLILGISSYYKSAPRADVSVGVLVLVTIMSDNERGACYMSQSSMGEILHRSRTAIAEAMTRLKTSGLVHSDQGRAGSSPIIPRVLGSQYNHIVWLTDALRHVPSTGQVNEPTCPFDGTGNMSARRDMSGGHVGSTGQVENEHVGSTGHNFTTDRSLTQNLEESLHSLSDLQDRKPDCASTEEPAKVDHLGDVSGQAIAEAAAKDAKPKPKRQKKAKPANGRPNYSDDFVAFWLAYPRHPNMSKANAFAQWGHLDAEDREWATKAADAYRAQQQRKAQQEGLSSEDIAHKTKHAERFLKDRRFDAYREHVEGKQAAEKCVSTGGSCASQEPAAHSATRFNDNTPKVAVVKSVWIDGATANRVLDAVDGATVTQVKDAMFEADRQPEAIFTQNSVFASNARPVVSPAKIVDWCIDWLAVGAQFANAGSAR